MDSRDRRRYSDRSTRLLCFIAGSTVLALSAAAPAHAFDFGLALDPGVAIPLSEPQSQKFNVGGSLGLKVLLGVRPYLAVTGGLNVIALSSEPGAPTGELGTSWATGGGLRLRRPHDAQSWKGVSPWVEAEALYVRTGSLDRFGFDVGAGASFPFSDDRTFWIGPFVRYTQILQPDTAGFDNRDAKIFILGVSLEAEVSKLHIVHGDPPAQIECAAAVACPPAPTIVVCSHDRDGDEIPDESDWCPDVRGPASNHGCPIYEHVRVGTDKLELDEMEFFAFDQATIEPSSIATLDEVVKIMADNKSFHLRIEGNTDSSGPNAHNVTLAERRATAVLEYLVSHGVARDRLTSLGNGSAKPNESNKTELGRENNRRVEFYVVKEAVK